MILYTYNFQLCVLEGRNKKIQECLRRLQETRRWTVKTLDRLWKTMEWFGKTGIIVKYIISFLKSLKERSWKTLEWF